MKRTTVAACAIPILCCAVFCDATSISRGATTATHRYAKEPTYKVLHVFTGGRDGAEPQAELLLDRTGLYGTTYTGGTANGGTVFTIDRGGKESVLYRFTGTAGPLGALIRDGAGNFYGTTLEGGSTGLGRVFKLSAAGVESDVHSFSGADGAYPRAGLLRDAGGNLYGTTNNGGDLNCTPPPHNIGCGTAFELNAAGRETALYSFTGGTDGFQPYSGLIPGGNGDLYSTTLEGGSSNCQGYGCGTVYKVDKAGRETALYVFTGLADGAFPNAVIRDASGNLYGTTGSGGTYRMYGTVFKVNPSGRETVLYSFTGGSDGSAPAAGLIHDAAGNLYGTTEFGGNTSCSQIIYGCGTVFRLDTAGHETVLHDFTGADGNYPVASLVMDAAGNLYGTTAHGGDLKCDNGLGCGVVFELVP